MKAKKRYPISGHSRAIRKNRRRMLKYAAVALAVLVISILVFTLFFPSSLPYHPNPNTFYFKAAVVDEESLTDPNPAFVQNVTTTLQDGGFTVDYVKGADVTVDFYENLPTDNYGIIILRVHSGVINGTNSNWVSMATSENYSINEYVWEQLDDELVDVRLSSNGESVFALGPNFKMNGHFENTLIIMMGCDGLGVNGAAVYMGLAEMLVNNGAKAYVGWSGDVSASGSDNAVEQLLQNLIVKRTTLGEALSLAPSDPAWGAVLIGYPNSESSFVILQESPQNNQTTGTTGTTEIYVNDAVLQNHESTPKTRFRFF
jgi:hypothetical protein